MYQFNCQPKMEPHASQDAENERLKLQNDIQKIQDTLYEDSYSEYDSSDDSCLEIDLGSSGRNPSTLTVTDDGTSAPCYRNVMKYIEGRMYFAGSYLYDLSKN